MRRLADNALQVLKSRYLLRDENGRICETPDQLFRRVADAVAQAELQWGGPDAAAQWSRSFYRLMTRLEFLPNSPTLMNAGLPKGQLSACFVLPLNDSLESIFTTLKNAALIHQSGGGTGFNFSGLRPAGDVIASTGGVSTGPVSFIGLFDFATETVRQGGKRRGANMGLLSVDHPDIRSFVQVKSGGRRLPNFNLSAVVTDAFMRAAETNGDWQLVNPRTGRITETAKAGDLWDLITEQAWLTGDPGLVFIDTVNRHNPVPGLGSIAGMNPCGEMPLLDFESCNLGSINLSGMVRRTETKKQAVDWDKLARIIPLAVRFLDDVIEVNRYVLPEIERVTRSTRKIGLGLMGWAEMLMQLGIPYASEEAVELARKLMAFVRDQSLDASAALARDRGAFPAWDKSVFYPHLPLRNAARTSIAPTGTISIIAGTSSSIEPLFALAFRRMGVLEGKDQWELNTVFLEKLKETGFWSEDLVRAIKDEGTLASIPGIPADLKRIFQTSLEIPWSYHVRHQAAFQEFTDNAVSKTINLPETATVHDISDAFRTAWRLGVKGITVFRNGSRETQVLRPGK
ncbi:MAG TPA: adenosylcobalamin-dependent ribonucleoside-diphosphate reductase [Flavilitoribacter sp.]|nr:adenosylcobalamin-dependent ribonucleoside-diphosphate reductase [Flavilitoribacter sp.]HMQ89400.1 adenosylcobalamin-dependent ribonucleoside-diphosphate reductase [Flavilitoribacter sp.]